jgi:hypothetical protein
MKFTLDKCQKLNNIYSLNNVINFTDAGEFTLETTGEGFTPTSVINKQQSYWGSSDVDVEGVGNNVVFASKNKKKLRSIMYSLESNGYSADDLTILVPHYFFKRNIKRLAYQNDNESIIWCITDDGTLLSCTFVPEEKVIAWCEHKLHGDVLDIVSCTDSLNSNIYLKCKKSDGDTYICMFKYTYEDDVYGCYYLDYGVSVDNTRERSDVLNITSTTTATSSAGSFIAGNVGSYIKTKDGGSALIASYVSTNEVTITIESSFKESEYIGDYWGVTQSTITGLDHLSGETVDMLVDGGVIKNVVVPSSSPYTITLLQPAISVHVGKPYQSFIRTLDLNLSNSKNSSVSTGYNSKKKAIPFISIKVEKSRGFKAGSDLNSLTESKQEILYYDIPTGLYSGIWSLYIQSKWNFEGSIYIEQSDPLPLNILSIEPEVVIGV